MFSYPVKKPRSKSCSLVYWVMKFQMFWQQTIVTLSEPTCSSSPPPPLSSSATAEEEPRLTATRQRRCHPKYTTPTQPRCTSGQQQNPASANQRSGTWLMYISFNLLPLVPSSPLLVAQKSGSLLSARLTKTMMVNVVSQSLHDLHMQV